MAAGVLLARDDRDVQREAQVAHRGGVQHTWLGRLACSGCSRSGHPLGANTTARCSRRCSAPRGDRAIGATSASGSGSTTLRLPLRRCAPAHGEARLRWRACSRAATRCGRSASAQPAGPAAACLARCASATRCRCGTATGRSTPNGRTRQWWPETERRTPPGRAVAAAPSCQRTCMRSANPSPAPRRAASALRLASPIGRACQDRQQPRQCWLSRRSGAGNCWIWGHSVRRSRRIALDLPIVGSSKVMSNLF